MQNDFLQPELRCEFQVSEKRKKIWKIQLELIEQLQRVCGKYHLRYFATNGTLLGAVRHGGFIPWDDDVDIVMPRPDYEKLMEAAQEEFQEPYFLQSAGNDSGYYRNFLRLRNGSTAGIPLKDWNRRCHNGIFIDIFPLDGCPENKLVGIWQRFLTQIYSAMANTYVYYPDFESRVLFRKALFLFAKIYCGIFGYAGLLQKMEQIRSRVPYDTANKVSMITHGSRCMVFPREYFEHAQQLTFEYIKIPVPENYDVILKEHYGNYRELPPKEDRGQHHSIFFDPDKPYTEYIGVMTKEEAGRMLNNY